MNTGTGLFAVGIAVVILALGCMAFLARVTDGLPRWHKRVIFVSLLLLATVGWAINLVGFTEMGS